jgi:glycosyltransferase involved in cell wall biosynthesis
MAIEHQPEPLEVLPQLQAAHNTLRQCLDRLTSAAGDPDFPANAERTPHLLSTCGSILLLEGAGGLADFSPGEWAVLGRYLQGFQDPASGLFHSSLNFDIPGEAEPDRADEAYRDTYFSLQALDALGGRAEHSLAFMDSSGDEKRLARWLEDLRGRAVMQAAGQLHDWLFFLIYLVEGERKSAAIPRFHQALDRLDPANEAWPGWMETKPSLNEREVLKAASLIIPFYRYVRRPVQRVKRLVDLALESRLPDGSLIRMDGRDSIADLPVVNLIAAISREVTYRQAEKRSALFSSLEAIRQIISVRGRELEGFPAGETGDPFFFCMTWLFLQAAETIVLIDPNPTWTGLGGRFRRWPGNGYNPLKQGLDERQRAALLAWQRELPGSPTRAAQESPAVSVIMPCFNLGDYVYESLLSVLSQTMQDLEIIIVNDGSTDEFTNLLLANLRHPLIRVIRQENRGLAAARNHGIRCSRGRYLCCLDPDDRLRPAFFERAVAVLDRQPKTGLVSGFFQMFDERDDLFKYDRCALPELLVYNQAIEAAVFRRAAWEAAGGYCETFSTPGIEDWDLWITLLENGYQAEVIPEVVYDYRIRTGQMSEGMYRPETWQLLLRELILRHKESYTRHLAEVIAGHGIRWVELREWTNERERAIDWWQRQAYHWQAQAGPREQYIQGLEARIQELETERAGLEELVDEALIEIAQERDNPDPGEFLARLGRRLEALRHTGGERKI